MTEERLEEVLRRLDVPEPPDGDDALRAACRATIPLPESGQRVRWHWNPFIRLGDKPTMLPRILALGGAATVAAIAAFSYGWHKRAAKVASVPEQVAPVFASGRVIDVDTEDSLAGMRMVPRFHTMALGLLAGVAFKAGTTFEEVVVTCARSNRFPDGGTEVYFDERYGRRGTMWTFGGRQPRRWRVETYGELLQADGTRIWRTRKRDGSGYEVFVTPTKEPLTGLIVNPKTRTLREFARGQVGSDVTLIHQKDYEDGNPTAFPQTQFLFRGQALPQLKGVAVSGRAREGTPYLAVEIRMDRRTGKFLRVVVLLRWEDGAGRQTGTAVLMNSSFWYGAIPKRVFDPEAAKRGVITFGSVGEPSPRPIAIMPVGATEPREHSVVVTDSTGSRVVHREILKPGQESAPITINHTGSSAGIKVLDERGRKVDVQIRPVRNVIVAEGGTEPSR